MPKKHVTTEMRWVNWGYLRTLPPPISTVVEAVYAICVQLEIANWMAFRCDWNVEVVAQFYATLWVDTEAQEMHWTLEGRRMSCSLISFANLFGF